MQQRTSIAFSVSASKVYGVNPPHVVSLSHITPALSLPSMKQLTLARVKPQYQNSATCPHAGSATRWAPIRGRAVNHQTRKVYQSSLCIPAMPCVLAKLLQKKKRLATNLLVGIAQNMPSKSPWPPHTRPSPRSLS